MPESILSNHVDFEAHMKEKADMWDAYQVHIGEDFAVFEFDNDEERDSVRKTLMHYEACYGYTSYSGNRQRFAIVKGKEL
jgi:hypothetical protein